MGFENNPVFFNVMDSTRPVESYIHTCTSINTISQPLLMRVLKNIHFVKKYLKSYFRRQVNLVMQAGEPAARASEREIFFKISFVFLFMLNINNLNVLKISKYQNPYVFYENPLFFGVKSTLFQQKAPYLE
jgi:hypothetical protein